MDFHHYVGILRKKMGWIAAFVLIAVTCAGVATDRYVPTKYEASIKLVVRLSEEKKTPEYGNVNANILMMTTYKEFLKSPTVLNRVVLEYPELKLTRTELDNNLRISSNKDSQIINMSFTSPSAERSQKIVEAVAVVFERLVPVHLKTDLLSILPQESLPGQEVKPNSPMKMNLILAFLASSFLSVAAVVFRETLDTTLKTERAVEELLGVGLLASISKPGKRDLKRRLAKQIQRQVGETTYAKG
ncbi:YveK family protein [Paenibacillus thermoaerophilus]|uniref:YveK family protein n=1 Tax=Paenibacillus thermoaerophilus TaxID=1215385 RepID=A0ABW2V6S7_9BACL|nr:Wzz/FepE/Etk N-terminal domain-containing protein [Paenibacillus thermoaerophilus]